MTSSTKHAPRLALLAMLTFALVLGLKEILTLPIWHDEAITLLQMAGNAEPSWPAGEATIADYLALYHGGMPFSGIIPMLIATDVHPPIFYFVASAWGKIAGEGPEIIRLISMAAVLGAAALSLRMVSRTARWDTVVAAAVLLISPTIAYAAINARGYGLALLFSTATIYFAQASLLADLEGNRTKSRNAILMAGLVGACAYLTHYFTLFVTAPAFLFLLARQGKKDFAALAGAAGTMVLGLGLSYPLMKVQFTAREGQFRGHLDAVQEFPALLMAYVDQFTVIDTTTPGLVLVISTGLVLLLAASAWLARKNPVAALHVTILVVIGICVYAMFWATDKTLTSARVRYFVFAVPSAAWLFAAIFRETVLQGPVRRRAIFGCALLFVLGGAGVPRLAGQNPHVGSWLIEPNRALTAMAVQDVASEESMVLLTTERRGHVGSLVHNLPEGTTVVRATSEQQVLDVFEEALTRDVVVVMTKNSDETFSDEIAQGRARMIDAGYKQLTTVTWISPAYYERLKQ